MTVAPTAPPAEPVTAAPTAPPEEPMTVAPTVPAEPVHPTPAQPTWPATTGAPPPATEKPEELATSEPEEIPTTAPEPEPLAPDDCPGVRMPQPDRQECPGMMVQVRVDRDTCFATGIDIVVDENHTHVEDFFYDNVGMKGDENWRELGGGGEEFEYELQDPRTKRFRSMHENLTDHRFSVGVSIVEVIGYDYAGNQHSCFRTVVVCDTPDEFCGKFSAQPTTLTRPEHAPAGLMSLSQDRDLSQLVQNARAHVHAHEPLMVQPASRSPKTLLSFRRAHKTQWVESR